MLYEASDDYSSIWRLVYLIIVDLYDERRHILAEGILMFLAHFNMHIDDNFKCLTCCA